MKKALHNLATLLKGRWHAPLALIAAGTATFAVFQLRPADQKLDFAALETELATLEHAERYHDAIDAAANVLLIHPDLPPEQQAKLHRRLSEILYLQECARPEPIAQNAALLRVHEDAARDRGAPVAPADRLRAATAAEWVGETTHAADECRQLLAGAASEAESRAAHQALVRLLDGAPQHSDERQAHLLALLGDAGAPPEYVWWGLQQALGAALDRGDAVAARGLLERYGGALGTSDLKGYLEYLTALVLVHEGRFGEATPIVDWIDQWLGRQAATAGDLDRAGYLPAMNRWLLGRIHLEEQRPQEALSAFDDVLMLQPDDRLRTAALASRGAALCLLERHAAALAALGEAADVLAADQTSGGAAQALRNDLVRLSDATRDRGELEAAVGYLRLAAALVAPEDLPDWLALHVRLAQAYRDAANAASEPLVRIGLLTSAAKEFEAAATRSQLDDGQYTDLLWAAAEAYDQAGVLDGAARALERFVETRSEDERLPAALLRLGEVYDAEGRLDKALHWYTRVIDAFPSLQEAVQAKLRQADCLAAQGAAGEAAAERLLLELIEADDIAPSAAAFRDASLRLGELLYGQGRFAEAIARLDQFLRLYPQDAERERVRFLLAEAHRRSALVLLADDTAADRGRAVTEGNQRLRAAAELYASLTALDPEKTNDAIAPYARLALFHQADCLAALSDAESLGAALALYRQAATRYEREPAALTAQVQMANILLRMGKSAEAARAVERARWLLRNIPDAAFASTADRADRSTWERSLATLSTAPLPRVAG